MVDEKRFYVLWLIHHLFGSCPTNLYHYSSTVSKSTRTLALEAALVRNSISVGERLCAQPEERWENWIDYSALGTREGTASFRAETLIQVANRVTQGQDRMRIHQVTRESEWAHTVRKGSAEPLIILSMSSKPRVGVMLNSRNSFGEYSGSASYPSDDEVLTHKSLKRW